MQRTILIVPGFLADTYSEIEKAFVELSGRKREGYSFIWLVPDISSRYNRYADPANRRALKEPLYVSYLRRARVRYVYSNLSPFNVIKNAWLFYRVFRKYNVDAVYTHYGFERFHAAFFAKVFGKKLIWNEHWYSMGTRFVTLKRVFYLLFVDAFIAVSGFIADTLPARSLVYTIPNAVGCRGGYDVCREDKDGLKRKLGIRSAGKVVLMIAAFRPEKRYDLALRICRDICTFDREVFFIFLGEGAVRQWFLKQIAECGLSRSVIAPGYVRNIEEYYMIADIVMLTSVREPCGYTILEAMKYGRPVITFASGGPKEIVADGYTGILVPEEDAVSFASQLRDLLGNPEKRRLLGSNALREVRQHYNRQKWFGDVTDVFGDVVPGREPVPDKEQRYLPQTVDNR